jgi:hypothetical protein
MILHQNVGIQAEPEAFGHRRQPSEESFPVAVVPHDVPAFVAPCCYAFLPRLLNRPSHLELLG